MKHQFHHHGQRLKRHLRELYLLLQQLFQHQLLQLISREFVLGCLHFLDHELTELDLQLNKYHDVVVVKLNQHLELNSEPLQSMDKPCYLATARPHQAWHLGPS